MDELSEMQSDVSSPPTSKMHWVVGNECVALRDDNRWYRAKITEVSNNLYRVSEFFLGVV